MGIKDNLNKSFTIDYRDEYQKRHRETIYGSKTLAKEILAKRKAEIAERKFFPDRKKQQLTFWEAADKYYAIHLSKKKSAFKMKYTIEFLKKYFGNKPLASITTADVQEFYNQRLAETSPSTANRHFSVLRAIINKVILLKLYKGENPCIGVGKQKENPARTNYLSQEEIKEVLLHIPERSRNLVAFAICTGMRRGEILRLDWKDIDWTNNIIHIYISKSGNKREVPIMPSLRQVLLSMHPLKTGKVFPLTEKWWSTTFVILSKNWAYKTSAFTTCATLLPVIL